MPRMQFPDAIELVFAQVLGDMREVDAEAAKRNPDRYSRSHVMGRDQGSRYTWYSGGRNGRGQKVRFCYSIGPNIAGRFLTWREVVGKRRTKRDQWSYPRSKKSAIGLARRHAREFRAR